MATRSLKSCSQAWVSLSSQWRSSTSRSTGWFRLAQQQAGECLKGMPPTHLGIDLRQLGSRLGDADQRQEVGERVLQTTIQRQHLARHLLAPPPVIVLRHELEVVVEQLNERQIRIRLAVRHRERLQHQAWRWQSSLNS